MIYNLPESEEESATKRKEEDLKNFNKVCSSLDITANVKTAFRTGDKKSDKIRPYKLVIENKKNRRDILLKAKEIRARAPMVLKKVIITPDYTPLQRRERKELLEDLQNKRKIHEGAFIRNSKVVIPKKPTEKAHVESISNQQSKTEEEEDMNEQHNITQKTYYNNTTLYEHIHDTTITDETIRGGIPTEKEPVSPEVNRD